MYHNFLVHLSANGHLGCFYVLGIINNAAMNTGVHVCLSILVSLVCVPKSGIAGSYGSSMSRFFKNLHIVFCSGYASLYSHQEYKTAPFTPHPLQHLLFVDFLTAAILTGVRQYLIVVLICISLIMSDVEHLFLWLLWKNVCLVFWPSFWLGRLFFWHWTTWASCLFQRLILCQLLHLLLFSPILKAVFSPYF